MPDHAEGSVGAQDYVGDPRNDSVLISVNGALTPRQEAKVSVFDSGFVLGDGVWEGLRLIEGASRSSTQHFDRLWDGAKMLRIDIGLTREALKSRLFDCHRRQWHDGRRAHPADGDARRQALALPGSASHRRRADDRHHPRMEAAAAGNVRPRLQALHRPHPPDRARPSRTRSSTRIPSSIASSPASRRWRRAPTKR